GSGSVVPRRTRRTATAERIPSPTRPIAHSTATLDRASYTSRPRMRASTTRTRRPISGFDSPPKTGHGVRPSPIRPGRTSRLQGRLNPTEVLDGPISVDFAERMHAVAGLLEQRGQRSRRLTGEGER